MDMLQTSVMNFEPNSNANMGQYVQAQNVLQNFQLPLQHLQGQNQIQLPGQQLNLLQLGQGQLLMNQSQLLQQLGQNQAAVQLANQGQQAIQLSGQQAGGQALHLPTLQQGQHLQALQLNGQQNQALQQLQNQSNQQIQIQTSTGQTFHLQGQNGQTIQLQGQNGQPVHIQSQNGQPVHLQGQNGQQIQLQNQNAQQIQLHGQGGQTIQLSNGQTIQLQGQGAQFMLQNGQPIQFQPQQLAQLQGQQLQLQGQAQSYQLQNQLSQALQLQGQQFQTLPVPGQQFQMASLQGQPCQIIHIQGPNGQIIQQVVPLMVGADQLGFMNPVQQMLLQAQNQNSMVGQFVQTESGLVWQPAAGMLGAVDSNATNGLNPGAAMQFSQVVSNQNQAITDTTKQEITDSSTANENNLETETSESQQSTLANGDAMTSVPGSTNTTTTSSQPAARIQIAAEDPDDDNRPLYVNAKQYHRILKRRAARAKLESTGKVVRKRKKYLHESRHKHACQRTRGVGGRFFSIKVENEAEFGVKEEPGSPHLAIPEHSPHSNGHTPSPSQLHLEVNETPQTISLNGHI